MARAWRVTKPWGSVVCTRQMVITLQQIMEVSLGEILGLLLLPHLPPDPPMNWQPISAAQGIKRLISRLLR